MPSTAFITLLSAVLPIYGIMILGATVRWKNWLNREADDSLMKLMIQVLFPCLIFEKIAGNPALFDMRNLTLAPVIGFGGTLLGFGAAFCGSRWLRLPSGPVSRTFTFTVGTCNYGYVPIPLTLLLFDDQTLGVLFLHNVGVEISFWTVGVAILSGKAISNSWKNFFNAPLIAVLAGIIVTFSGAKPYVPDMFLTAMRMLGQCAIPSALILIGAIIFDHLSPQTSRLNFPVISMACLIRLCLLPVIILTLARFLPCSVELKHVLVLESAMPTAVFPIVMSKHYQGDLPTALQAAIATSLISIISTPLWIKLGLHWVG